MVNQMCKYMHVHVPESSQREVVAKLFFVTVVYLCASYIQIKSILHSRGITIAY